MPPVSVLIKPASSKCNLKCKYCFYHDVANNRTVADYGFMKPEIAEAIAIKVLQFAEGQATFSFQGGEPTLCGIDFFKTFVKLQNKYNVNNALINNCIQTNGVLINEEWAEFLHDYRFLVGLSLDGPQDIHDKYRVDAMGNGTWSKVMQAVELFNKHKVEYNILFTITSAGADQPEKIYRFFKSSRFKYLQFMPCIDPEKGERGIYRYSLAPEQYASFLKQFFDHWYKDIMHGKEISIRYYDNLVRIIMGIQPEICSLYGSCRCQFVFEADGSVYPCDFYVKDEWKLGNINESSLPELYESNACRRFIESSLVLAPACHSCKWRPLCRGGCRRDRENTYADNPAKNYYCSSYRSFLEYAYPRLGKIAGYIKSLQYKNPR